MTDMRSASVKEQASIESLKRVLDLMDRSMTLETVLPVREAFRATEDILGGDENLKLTDYFTTHEIDLIASALNFDPKLQG